MKNITVAKSWSELNAWQLEEIVHLYLNLDDHNFKKSFDRMIFILFQKKKGFWSRLKLHSLLRMVPISELHPFGQFLLEQPKIHSFPEIKNLIKPADRLGDLSVKQFSFMDQFFNSWMDTKSEDFLRALCACIYRTDNNFDELNLPKVAKYTDQIPPKKLQAIGFIYMSCYHHITEQFPVIWPKAKKTESEAKKPTKKHQYKPFSEVIINVAMSENQPLGNLHESNSTRIYEFLNVLTKILIQQQQK